MCASGQAQPAERPVRRRPCAGIRDIARSGRGRNTRLPGVEHRIESVREKDGVLYINDSKGTNPDATIKALEAMTRPVRLILGGFDKHGEFDGLMERLEGVKEIVALGETRDRIAQAARKAGFEAVETVDNLEEAVARLSSRAEAETAFSCLPPVRAGICIPISRSAAPTLKGW